MSPLAVVTGGSSGIGMELGRQLYNRGYSLALIARDEGRLANAASSILGARSDSGSQSIHCYSCDVNDSLELPNVFEDIHKRFSDVQFLINAAGVASIELLQDCDSIRRIADTIGTNLVGAINTTYLTLPLMKSNSHVLFVSSGFGLVGSAGYSLYAASKGGMNNFADALRRELLNRGISVHLACPGDVATPMYEHELETMPDWIFEKNGRGNPISARLAAKRILKGCERGRFLITTSSDVRLLMLVQRMLPNWLALRVIDQFLPLPSYADGIDDHQVQNP